eukprot:c8365_g1_i3.p1 GENE.c8365_g1_i3~~c8365_g1_i3.p1  ORF type:complete len:305 (-),score=65.05 c8365_g1_i3:36-950(-)
MANIDDLLHRLWGSQNRFEMSNIQSNEIEAICELIKPVLLQQPSLLELSGPIVVCGDIRGQFTDLLRIFDVAGRPPTTKYLFLGNYNGRKPENFKQIETVLLLFILKIKYPDSIHLLRGNYECGSISRIYGFYDEVKRRFSVKLWKKIVMCFDCIPIAAIVNEKIFCCHGGLSPDLRTFDDIRAISRPTDVPEHGLLCDLLWNDPSSTLGYASDYRLGYEFGPDVLTRFLEKHNLDFMCRGHQIVESGYEFFCEKRLVTLFSSPSVPEFENLGAIMIINSDRTIQFTQFQPVVRRFESESYWFR